MFTDRAQQIEYLVVKTKGHGPVTMVSVSQNLGAEWIRPPQTRWWVWMAKVSGKPFHSSNVLLDLPCPNMDVFFKQWSYLVTGITWVWLLLETENVYCLPEGRGGLLVQHHMTSVGEFVLILDNVTSCNSVMEFQLLCQKCFYTSSPAHVLKLFSLSFLPFLPLSHLPPSAVSWSVI